LQCPRRLIDRLYEFQFKDVLGSRRWKASLSLIFYVFNPLAYLAASKKRRLEE